MANTITLKRRINSVRNTRQITKAMELVAASKMRRAQEHALRTRDFYTLAQQILTRLRQLTDVTKHPLYRQQNVKTRLHILITSDQGLAGAYDANLLKQFSQELQQDHKDGVTSQVISIGRKGSSFVSRLEGVELLAAYHHFAEQPTANDIRPILNTIVGLFITKKVDAVDVIYTDYKTSLSQIVTSQRLLPAAYQDVPIEPDLEQALFEPSPEAVLEAITLRLIEAQLNQAFSEAQASEHSMRMMAMKNATDNANDLIDDLTLAFNTARQAAITQELAEITAGAEAIQ
ncbi:MAG: atpG [Candidatus Saccharibacteria bacterium]|nr:atpG [Candidatus Saccharibacteria bacterium]